MDSPHEAASPEQSVERLKVVAVTRGKNPTTRLSGSYEFEDLKTEGPVTCHWRFQPELVGLSVYGDVQGVVTQECARCLEPYQVLLKLDIQERYVFADSLEQAEKERELQADDFYEVLDEEGELDLKDLAHQFLILELANYPNCERPNCEPPE